MDLIFFSVLQIVYSHSNSRRSKLDARDDLEILKKDISLNHRRKSNQRGLAPSTGFRPWVRLRAFFAGLRAQDRLGKRLNAGQTASKYVGIN